MSRRDYIEEILAKKLRSQNKWQNSNSKLFQLEQNFREIKKNSEIDISQYSLFLVGIVTCLEVGIREAIQRLVDKGTPYIERIEKFKDFLKVDLNVTKALHDRKVSFGELVSHLLPVNNIENIISHFGVLLDSSFTEKLRTLRYFQEPDLSKYLEESEEENIEEEQPIEEELESPALMIDDVNILISHLNDIFIKRHIIVHEANFEAITTKEELDSYFETAIIFDNALDELVEQTINPDEPRHTMYSAVIESYNADRVTIEMQDLVNELNDIAADEEMPFAPSEKVALENSQKCFLVYLKSELELEAATIRPGTGYYWSYITANLKKELCLQRIERLKEIKKILVEEDIDSDDS